jgi:hypothetical protein
MGISHRREILKHFRHFISSLTTTNVDNNVGVGILGKRLRNDSLSTAEGAGNSCRSTKNATSN